MTVVLLYLFKPFLEVQQFRIETVTFCLFLFSYVFLFIISINEDNGCTFCGNREGVFCYLITIPIFLGLLVNCLMFYYLLYDDLKYEKEPNSLEFHNPWQKTTVQKLVAKVKKEKTRPLDQHFPQRPHLETEQGSIIFTDRNEELKEIEHLKLKQASMESFLDKAKQNNLEIQTLDSNDLESEVFKEEFHELDESIELFDENNNKIK